jgi:hypothetical protein
METPYFFSWFWWPLLHEVDLQVLNGISLGKILHSDKTCAAIASHIATEMKKNICKDIISTKKKISVLIDESTTLSKRTVLIVVLRVFFEDIPGDAYTFNYLTHLRKALPKNYWNV